MAPPRRVDAFVRRLEDRVAAAIEGTDRVVLAYSGGLASTLVAMVARKRCDLRCFVAGVQGSPDVEAAKVAKDYLDYRMHFVTLDAKAVRALARRITDGHRSLTATECGALVPLHAVLRRVRCDRVLAGFGGPHIRPAILEILRSTSVRIPLHGIVRGPLPRDRLRDAALRLGLPADWARTRHRAPAEGAGIEEFLHGNGNGSE